MSNDEKKKDDELECLNKVIATLKNQHGMSKKIIKLLNGEPCFREKEERPDFLRITKEKNTAIGIEHFKVDRCAKKTSNDKIISRKAMSDKQIHNVYKTWRDPVLNSDHVPEGAINALAKELEFQLEMKDTSSYQTLFESFKHGINQHVRSVDEYRKNIKNTAFGYNIEFAFLIEIYGEFQHHFVVSKNSGTEYKSKLVPMFEEFVEFIEKEIPHNKVQYLVFYIYNLQGEQIITTTVKNIRSDLLKQHIPIYEYGGEDYFLKGFSAVNNDKKVEVKSKPNEQGGFTLTSKFINYGFDMGNIIRAVNKTVDLMQKNKSVLVTYPVYRTLEVKNIIHSK